MKILSVNAGSSSLKFTLFEMPEGKELIGGYFEKIGLEDSFYNIKMNGEKTKHVVFVKDHAEAVRMLINELIENKVIESLEDLDGIGHRLVHGGEKYTDSILIDDEVIKTVTELIPLAPLHNPANLTGVKAFMDALPSTPNVGVFDTAFHQTMAKEQFLYSMPLSWYNDYKVRKYGFHGTSHKYVAYRMNEILGRYNTKLITCHIGNGASISAINEGVCVNTSMGLTPNSGLMMGSRCGDMDATVITYMMQQLECSPEEMDAILNKQCGLLGVSGVSSDSRDIEDGMKIGNQRCSLAQKMFTNRIIDHIAKYYVELGGCDAIVFTAGIGENSIHTRREVIDGLAALGVKIDEEANECRGVERLITAEDSSIPCYVIPTNEELMIARDTYMLYQEKEKEKELIENEII
ncbi:MAG: acetate kinase [Erysipelotrichaceae bacterium]|nr:acetate kinase [Erysipelotrichaceae bacterium]